MAACYLSASARRPRACLPAGRPVDEGRYGYCLSLKSPQFSFGGFRPNQADKPAVALAKAGMEGTAALAAGLH